MRSNRRIACATLALITLAGGLVWRLVPLGLVAVLVKYGGSILWAIMVYWLVAFFLPKKKPQTLAIVAGMVAVAVECFKLYHSPGLNAFRHTLAGQLLLGRIFSLRDIVAYWLAIAVTACFDSRTNQ
ncbi:ribosomal maturation YjgA family protein [Granulicella mallensis]|uniref:DUF2809 domain-containing protein n=1 Tax=Granulicella mallensis (strain ATCC BAA-1857 / DSM 23137 / MP5ACTX8) TaxID=682795 RepID=G8NYW7_GRAMM|nr:DUF2809 domain-containing protein [Granulicella mallensis]AEU34530.1 hypothetical protein AciX8_0172 [Granulicella mallensis MP5ACTX8]